MTKKIKLLTALAALLIAAAGVMTFEACNKKESINTTAIKKPIAVKNANSDDVIYNVPLSKIQNVLDRYTASKGLGEVIVESWSIIDDGSTEKPVLMVSLIDVGLESSSKIAFYNTFIERTMANNSIEYYLTDLICSGNYSYITSNNKDTYLVTVANNEVVSVELYGAKSSWTGGVTVKCTIESGCKKPGECWPTDKGCTPCEWGICKQTVSATFETICLTAFN